MQQFQGNSNASKEKQKETLEPKQIDAITSQVTMKKQSEMSKFKKQLFTEDAKSVKGHIVSSVLIPGIQRLISDIIKNGIDWLIYGGKSTGNQSGIRNVSYSNFYDRTRTNTPTIPSGAYVKNNIFSVNTVTFMDRGEAEEVLMRLREEIIKYQVVSVADFYDMVSQKHSYTDCKYGWRDLRGAEVSRVRDGYYINFPNISPIEG